VACGGNQQSVIRKAASESESKISIENDIISVKRIESGMALSAKEAAWRNSVASKAISNR